MSIKNPTLLELLKTGARVTFDDGFFLQGLPDDHYIRVGNEHCDDGLWFLNEDGLEQAIDDVEKMREELHSE